MQTLCSGIESAHIRVIFFSFKIEETYTLTAFVDQKLRACLHKGGGPQIGEVTRLGGVIKKHFLKITEWSLST